MPSRLRLYDIRASRFPRLLGLCQDNVPAIAAAANAVQERLLYAKEAGSESWYGTWAEIAFELTQERPYVTLGRDIARLEGITICDRPYAVNNQFIQYLQFGNGRLRKNRRCGPGLTQAVSRNNVVLFTELSTPPQYIRAYPSDSRDSVLRTLIQGKDANDNIVYSTDNFVEVTGVFLALGLPFAQTAMTFNSITGIQKDVTYGKVDYYQVDPTTGDEVLLLTMQPGETTASYRRYFFNNLPCGCCTGGGQSCDPVNVTAIAKLELIPMAVDTDYALLQSLEAFIHEAQSMRYDEADTPAAKGMARDAHIQAIRLLMGQNGHYQGIRTPAVNFAPFGTPTLETQSIAMQ